MAHRASRWSAPTVSRLYSRNEIWNAFLPYIQVFVGRLLPPPAGYSWGSWGRNERENEDAGGSFESQHRVWTAVDVRGPGSAPYWYQEQLRRRGLIVVDEGDHLHIQLWPAGALSKAGVNFSRLA